MSRDSEIAAYLDDLLEEWRLTAEAGWNRPLSVEEARIVLAELERRAMADVEGESGSAWIDPLTMTEDIEHYP